MKVCPQCGSVFDDALAFCTRDGAPLEAENSAPPVSANEPDEEITVIRRPPVTINIPGETAPDRTPEISAAAAVNQPEIIVRRQRSNTGKYVAFLLIGLITGGVLVLAALLTARSFYRNDAAANVRTGADAKPAVNTREARVVVSPSPSPAPSVEVALNSEHQTRTAEDDEEFNGRVIAANANVRSAPSKNASQVDLLPLNDRLKIERRENESSPWYYVSCEHGTVGWMHGDTIEFTQSGF